MSCWSIRTLFASTSATSNVHRKRFYFQWIWNKNEHNSRSVRLNHQSEGWKENLIERKPLLLAIPLDRQSVYYRHTHSTAIKCIFEMVYVAIWERINNWISLRTTKLFLTEVLLTCEVCAVALDEMNICDRRVCVSLSYSSQ